jgi:arsenical pump membrane protein
MADTRVSTGPAVGQRRLALTTAPRILAGGGLAAAATAAALKPSAAQSAAQQNWPAFVLVSGLLLIGLAAHDDHLFSAVGHRLAAAAPDGRALFAGLAVLIVLVTAVLNLDTSVAFITPVVVYTAHRRRDDGAVLLGACLLLANAGSLLLPGSNLTNLIVFGHSHPSGSSFASTMVLPWIVAATITAAVIAVVGRRQIARPGIPDGEAEPLVLGVGAVSIGIAVLLVVLLSSPALAVLAVGLAATGLKLAARRLDLSDVREVLGLPVLVGLFGLAVGLGTAGREWSLPSRVLEHLGPLATAAAAGASAVALNNLPAASLLAARVPPHPYSLLIGLNIGPNLFATGSLAWVLWIRAARVAGVRAPVRRTTLTGLIAAPIAIVGAVVALELVGGRT